MSTYMTTLRPLVQTCGMVASALTTLSSSKCVEVPTFNVVDLLIWMLQRLGKNPEDYPDAKSQPHVQVALRMKTRGQSAKSGDVVPYIFCLSEGEVSSKTAQADRAYHPDEIRRSNGKLMIGEYLLLLALISCADNAMRL